MILKAIEGSQNLILVSTMFVHDRVHHRNYQHNYSSLKCPQRVNLPTKYDTNETKNKKQNKQKTKETKLLFMVVIVAYFLYLA